MEVTCTLAKKVPLTKETTPNITLVPSMLVTSTAINVSYKHAKVDHKHAPDLFNRFKSLRITNPEIIIFFT